MGYVTKTDKPNPWGQFAATAVKALSGLPQQIQEDKQKKESFELKQSIQKFELDELQDKSRLLHSKRLNDLIGDGLEAEDKKSWMKLNQKDIETSLQKSGVNVSSQDIEALINLKDENLAAAFKDLKGSTGFLMTATPSTQPQPIFRTQSDKALAAFDTIMGKMPSGLKQVYKKGKEDFVEQAQKLRDKYIDYDAKALEAKKKKEASPYQELLGEDRLAKAAQTAKLDLEKNQTYKKLADQEVSASFLQDLITEAKAGNQVAANSMGAKAARAMGEVGVLTEEDVSRYVRGGSITRSTADKLLKWTTGKPSNMTLDEISKVQGIFEKQFNLKVQPVIDRHIETFTRNWLKTPKNSPEWNTKVREAQDRLGFTHSGQKATVDGGGLKTVIRQGYNKKTNKTVLIYSDGSQEIVSGQR